jgi:hypothetical protein
MSRVAKALIGMAASMTVQHGNLDGSSPHHDPKFESNMKAQLESLASRRRMERGEKYVSTELLAEQKRARKRAKRAGR